MLKLKLDICQPRPDGPRVAQDILLVDCVFFGLESYQLGLHDFSGYLDLL